MATTGNADQRLLFAAGATFTGNPGQGAYAATGAVALSLAALERSRGQASSVVAFGPWRDHGQWPGLSPRQQRRLADDGIAPLSTAQALAAVDAACHGAVPELCLPGCDGATLAGLSGLVLASEDGESAPAETTATAAPSTTVTRPAAGGTLERLRQLFAEHLGIAAETLDTRAAPLDLGIDSLDAVQLGEAIETGFGVALSIGDIVDATGLADLAGQIDEQRGGDAHVSIRLRPGHGRPLFVLPADSATALSMKGFADGLGGHRPVHALQAPGIDRGGDIPNSIATLARCHRQAVIAVQDRGPYTLLGRCSGGLAAFELALQLQARGHDVDRLVLLDTLPPGADDDMLRHRQARIDADSERRFAALPDEARQRFRHIHARLREAAAGYRPTARFRGELVLVCSKDDRHPAQQAWQRHVDGTLALLTTPGDHASMFLPPRLASLCATVSTLIDPGEP